MGILTVRAAYLKTLCEFAGRSDGRKGLSLINFNQVSGCMFSTNGYNAFVYIYKIADKEHQNFAVLAAPVKQWLKTQFGVKENVEKECRDNACTCDNCEDVHVDIIYNDPTITIYMLGDRVTFENGENKLILDIEEYSKDLGKRILMLYTKETRVNIQINPKVMGNLQHLARPEYKSTCQLNISGTQDVIRVVGDWWTAYYAPCADDKSFIK